MNIQEAVRRFQEAGLIVLPMPKDIQECIRCLEEAQRGIPSLANLRLASAYEQVDDDPQRRIYKELSGIWYQDDSWIFRKWEYVPGPGYDEIHFVSDHLDRIVEAALNYYFGEPTIIDHWIIPLHKHPEWNASYLPSVIASCQRISQTDWKLIHKNYTERRWQLHPNGTLPEIFACLFNPIAHVENPNLTLYLRRDLGEAFVIETQV